MAPQIQAPAESSASLSTVGAVQEVKAWEGLSTPCDSKDCPVVFVAGFLAPKTEQAMRAYWGHAAIAQPQLRKIFLTPSSVASVHDRVCEIFYQLKGGRVDYGKEHADQFGHCQFGKDYGLGLFPEWGEDHPIHLVGHSYGGLTLRVLQHYLEIGFFAEQGTSARWIRSVTAINSPLNGSLSVYGLGANKEDPVKTHIVSPGFFLGLWVHLYEFLDITILKESVYDFGLDYWNVSWRQGLKKNLTSIFSKARHGGVFCEGVDNGAYDLSVHAVMDRNREMQDSASTYYFSITGNREKEAGSSSPRMLSWGGWALSRVRNAAWSLLSFQNSQIKWAKDELFPGFDPKEWLKYGHDGLVSVYSQRAPLGCASRPLESFEEDSSAILPGVWHYHDLNTDHLGLVPTPSDRAQQESLFEDFFGLIASLPAVKYSTETQTVAGECAEVVECTLLSSDKETTEGLAALQMIEVSYVA